MSSQQALVSGIAGRYAVALYDLALEQKALDKVAGEIGALGKLLDEGGAFAELVTNPLLSRDQHAEALATVATKAKLSKTTSNFLGVLAENRRLPHLGAVIAGFQKLVAHERGEVTAEVTSAQPLSKGDLDALGKQLKKATGRKVTFDTHIDESLLGGLVVKVGSRMYDSSLRTKLQNLRVAMKGVE